MNIKKLQIICLPLLAFSFSAFTQAEKEPPMTYEVTKAMPTFYESLKETLTYPMAWGHSRTRNFKKWKAEGRKKVLECMAPAPPVTTFNPVVIAEEQRDGYKVQKILFNVSAFSRVPAYLLIPDGKGPFPAILALHDHGAHFTIGKEKMVRPFGVSEEITQDAEKWSHACYDGVFVGDMLAQNGYVVLAVDALLWGERGRKEGADYDAQQALASNLLQMGMAWGSLIAWDDLRSVSFLGSLPVVQKKNIGVIGHSMGCHRAWMTAALTDEVKAGVAICWMNTTEYLMTLTNNQNKGGSAYAMLIPGVRNYLDYPHVASLACPKPMLFINGEKDKLFPVEGVNQAFKEMHKVWQSQKADAHLRTEIVDSPHFFGKAMQQEALEFLNQQLKK